MRELHFSALFALILWIGTFPGVYPVCTYIATDEEQTIWNGTEWTRIDQEAHQSPLVHLNCRSGYFRWENMLTNRSRMLVFDAFAVDPVIGIDGRIRPGGVDVFVRPGQKLCIRIPMDAISLLDIATSEEFTRQNATTNFTHNVFCTTPMILRPSFRVYVEMVVRDVDLRSESSVKLEYEFTEVNTYRFGKCSKFAQQLPLSLFTTSTKTEDELAAKLEYYGSMLLIKTPNSTIKFHHLDITGC